MFESGQLLGPYEVGALLGSGGMASVFAARHATLGHAVAIKVLHWHLAQNEGIRDRFLAEARLQATLRSPHIVRVFDIIEERGVPAVVMDLIEGRSLAAEIDAGVEFSVDEVVAIARQTMLALEVAHAHGAIHRDVKPDNILRRARIDGQIDVLLVDFGIAKIADGIKRTGTGRALGTIAYMSPEQVQNSAGVDARTDLYSLGATVWELLSAEQPYGQYEASDPQRAIAVVNEPLGPLPSTVPQWLSEWVVRMTAKDAAARYTDARSALGGLEGQRRVRSKTEVDPLGPVLAEHSVPPRPKLPPQSRPVATESTPPTGQPSSSRSRWVILSALSGVGVLVVLAAIGLGRGGTSPASPGVGVAEPVAVAPPPPAHPPADMVLVARGTFTMGSPLTEAERGPDETEYDVTLTRDFWLSRTEVTQGEYEALMLGNPSGFSDCGSRCPVERVSWLDAVAYANARSRSEDLALCYEGSGRVVGGASIYDCAGYRLPTEAEWEYAARAGTRGWSYGDLNAIAWHNSNADSRTHLVCEKEANAWGLCDMLGNVWEWCHDAYATYPTGLIRDPVSERGSRPVYRGGSWNDYAGYVRAARRNSSDPSGRSYGIGFRLVRTVPESARAHD